MDLLIKAITILTPIVVCLTYANKQKSSTLLNSNNIATLDKSILEIKSLMKESDARNALEHQRLDEKSQEYGLDIVFIKTTIKGLDGKMDMIIDHLRRDS
jgi:hypothetical protein